MANRDLCRKHNMIANLDKTAANIPFHAIIDFLAGSTINYALLVNPDVIGPLIHEFWSTAAKVVEEDDVIITATVTGRPIRISEVTIREDLQFNDADGAIQFDNAVIWATLEDIGYEGDLTKTTFQKPLFSPHWKYLIHVLLHCLSSKSTSWDQFPKVIASALVGLSTNQPFNFSRMILDGMLAHIDNGSPFLMYPRFIQVFLNKQLEDIPRPPDFLPAVVLPSKVFTFMIKRSAKFSGRNTPLTAHILEVAQAVAAEGESSDDDDEGSHASTASQSAVPTPVPSPSQGAAPSPSQGAAPSPSPSHHQDDTPPLHEVPTPPHDTQSPSTQFSHHTVLRESTVNRQGTALHDSNEGTASFHTSARDEGVMDNYALTRELRRLKKVTEDQAVEILTLKRKFKKFYKSVWPLVKHHRLFVKSKKKLQRVSKSKKKKSKKHSTFQLGRNLQDNLNEDAQHFDAQDEGAAPMDLEITPVLKEVIAQQETIEKKSDETEKINIEEEHSVSEVKSGDTKEVNLDENVQSAGVQAQVQDQGTFGQGTVR